MTEALRKGQKGPGLTAFYKTMLDSEESKHAAAVSATSKPAMGPSLAIRPPTEPSKPVYDDEEEYDPFFGSRGKGISVCFCRKEAREGRHNDDG